MATERFIVHADEILTAFMELQRAIHEFAVSLDSCKRSTTHAGTRCSEKDWQIDSLWINRLTKG
jgi:hypothetical protein